MAHNSTRFKAGDTLFREGEDAASMYLVLSGRVSIQKTTGESKFIEVGTIGPNQIIGEVPFFDKQPRSASAVASTSVEVVEIPYSAFEPIFRPAPDYLKKIMLSLALRLRDADDRIRELKEKLGEFTGHQKSENTEIEEISDTAQILALTEEKKKPETK